MKKKILCALLMSLVVFCLSCGGQKETTTDLHERLILAIESPDEYSLTQTDLQTLYDSAESGKMFEDERFTYVTEYGKDRYNFDVMVGDVRICIYHDFTVEEYGVEIGK